MAETTIILRKTIFTFLKHYEYFTLIPSLLALPFAISILTSQFIIPQSSYPFQLTQDRILSIFINAGFSPVLELFETLSIKLSETILTFIISFPFTLTFSIISKASTIRTLNPENNDTIWDLVEIINSLFITQLCNTLVIISANATCFVLIAIIFNCAEFLGFSTLMTSVFGAIIYSIVIANVYVICNLALVLSGTEKRGGFVSILKAFLVVRGEKMTALCLSVWMNLGLVAIEFMFQCRIVRTLNQGVEFDFDVVEGSFICYLYAVMLVIDTIVGSFFLKSCKTFPRIEMEDVFCHSIQIEESFPNYSDHIIVDDDDELKDWGTYEEKIHLVL